MRETKKLADLTFRGVFCKLTVQFLLFFGGFTAFEGPPFSKAAVQDEWEQTGGGLERHGYGKGLCRNRGRPIRTVLRCYTIAFGISRIFSATQAFPPDRQFIPHYYHLFILSASGFRLFFPILQAEIYPTIGGTLDMLTGEDICTEREKARTTRSSYTVPAIRRISSQASSTVNGSR